MTRTSRWPVPNSKFNLCNCVCSMAWRLTRQAQYAGSHRLISTQAAAARTDDVARLEKTVSDGRCLDARNRYGESLVHAACAFFGSSAHPLLF